eukprot:8265853-Prorocentrum_lima.AAC.1
MVVSSQQALSLSCYLDDASLTETHFGLDAPPLGTGITPSWTGAGTTGTAPPTRFLNEAFLAWPGMA